ncbi:MAG: helix-turn-helix transcriptional regulator [Lachnospiraceae bacterium]|nr:helix-turn-helix transcriptional regulator [Lachnospiraceae bacterium]
MKSVYLPEKELLPNVRMARLYDTEQDRKKGAKIPRVSDCYELSCYISAGGILTVDDSFHALQAGDVSFTRPGQLVGLTPPYSALSVYFTIGDGKTLPDNELLSGIPVLSHAGEVIEENMRKLCECSVSDEIGMKAASNGLLLTILSELYRALHEKTQYSHTVSTVLTYIESHLDGKWTLDDLGRMTGYSPLHLLRIFREETQKTPHDLAAVLRMAKARKLLKESDLTVSEIAQQCGYRSESYFHEMFREENHMTPGRYRQSARL